MLFRRKAYQTLMAWKSQSNGKRAMLIIEGTRRVGKSTLAQEFAQHEYEGHLVIDSEHRHGYFATISQLRPRTSWPG